MQIRTTNDGRERRQAEEQSSSRGRQLQRRQVGRGNREICSVQWIDFLWASLTLTYATAPQNERLSLSPAQPQVEDWDRDRAPTWGRRSASGWLGQLHMQSDRQVKTLWSGLVLVPQSRRRRRRSRCVESSTPHFNDKCSEKLPSSPPAWCSLDGWIAGQLASRLVG